MLQGEVPAPRPLDGPTEDEASSEKPAAATRDLALAVEAPRAEAGTELGLPGDRKGRARGSRMDPEDAVVLDQCFLLTMHNSLNASTSNFLVA